MNRAFKSLRNVDLARKALYLAFIQDLGSPANSDSGLVMIGCGEDIEAVESALINAGQRYPGLAIRLLGMNMARFSGAGSLPPSTLADFELRVYDYVVLCHAPSPRLLQRVVITDVFKGWAEDDERRKAEASLASRTAFALMGQVFLIGDSENGPCQGMIKSADSSLLRPWR